MEGKGWVVTTGILAIVAIFLTISNLQLAGKVKDLERTPSPTPSAQPSEEPTETPSAEPTPDLSTPAKRDAVRKAELAEIEQALIEYKDAKGQYPSTLNELVPDYLDALPTDPLAPKYVYRYQKIGAGYRVTCYLETKNDPDDAKDGKRDQIYVVVP